MNESFSANAVADARHAFLIMAHKDDETFNTLLELLDDPRNAISIHMDAKNVGWDENATVSRIRDAHCYVVPRMDVLWGV